MPNDALGIEPIRAFDDNYIWLLTRESYGGCAVVDPGDSEPVIETLEGRGLRLEAILVTHKHGDHVGGIAELVQRWPGVQVFGPANEPIKRLSHRLGAGDEVRLDGLGTSFEVLDVPGHTEGHIAYVGEGLLFCGDTLFACGCGRVFSGTFEQLSDSLQLLTGLPVDTRCYCAHEYTQDNIGFARWVEPDNPDLQLRAERVALQRAHHRAVRMRSRVCARARLGFRCAFSREDAAAVRTLARAPSEGCPGRQSLLRRQRRLC